MTDKKLNDAKSLLEELEKLIEVTGDNCGPVLIKELQRRLDKTINTFNKDLKRLLSNSFKNHDNKIQFCKDIIKDRKIMGDNKELKNEEEKFNAPHFIQLYEKKYGKKL